MNDWQKGCLSALIVFASAVLFDEIVRYLWIHIHWQ